MLPQQYCLRWKHHHSNVQSMFAQLLEKERFCDVTLYCSPSFATQVPNKDTVDAHNIRGVSLRAHRVVLAACSELLGALLGAHEAQGEPVLVIDGAEPRHLRALLDYMYTGEMNVHHSQLAGLLKTAEELRIKGLTDIRWNNKDEPPDCSTGAVTTTPHERRIPDVNKPATDPKNDATKHTDRAEPKTSPDAGSPEVRNTTHEAKNTAEKNTHDKNTVEKNTGSNSPEVPENVSKEIDETEDVVKEKFSVNGGPPPLIKLPFKEKCSPIKREHSDTESPSPKRQRVISNTEHTDDENSLHLKTERDQEWRHGNLDITAERVVGWGAGESGDWSRDASDDEWADAPADIGSFLHTKLKVDGDNSAVCESGDWSRDASDDEWADAPVDIGSFLHTKLKVDGDNSADEESDGSGAGAPHASSSSSTTSTAHIDYIKPTKLGVQDPRFTDVIKLHDYLQHGRRPQFWEENYVKRVMEAVRLKELEMKQAAEILGVSYGTLYGRYRDVYGCINRPYRTAREFWQAKGPSDVLDRLQRSELSLEAAALALGVNPANLASYIADCPEKAELVDEAEKKMRSFSNMNPGIKPVRKLEKMNMSKKVMVGSFADEDPIPATIISAQDKVPPSQPASSGKWPSIRVASLESLRGAEAPPSPAGAPPSPGGAPLPAPSPSQLMRTRPDLTIVAARRERHS